MIVIVSKLIVSIVIWFSLGSLLLPLFNLASEKLNDKNYETNEFMVITVMIFTLPVFITMPFFL